MKYLPPSAVALVSVSTVSLAQAQISAQPESPTTSYATGAYPSTALGAFNIEYEVNQSTYNNLVDEGVAYEGLESNGIFMAHGFASNIASDSGNFENDVIEVHQADQGVAGALWYHTGQYTGNPISWNSQAQYDNGFAPAVAALTFVDSVYGYASGVAEVHQAEPGAGALWMRPAWGSQNEGLAQVHWFNSFDYDSGVAPSVAIAAEGTQQFLVVEAHQSGSSSTGPLMFRTGVLSFFGCSGSGGNCTSFQMSWMTQANGEPSMQYGVGENPSVAFCSSSPERLPLYQNSGIVEVHEYEGTLYYQVANYNLQEELWSWTGPVAYGAGYNPKFACQQTAGIEVHQASQPGAGGETTLSQVPFAIAYP